MKTFGFLPAWENESRLLQARLSDLMQAGGTSRDDRAELRRFLVAYGGMRTRCPSARLSYSMGRVFAWCPPLPASGRLWVRVKASEVAGVLKALGKKERF